MAPETGSEICPPSPVLILPVGCNGLSISRFNRKIHAPAPDKPCDRDTLAVRNIGKKIVPCNVSGGKFSAQGLAQQGPGVFVGESQSEDVHEFGHGGFGRHVVSGEHAGLLQFQSCFVEVHRDPSAAALGDVEQDDSAVDGLLDDADEALRRGGVSGAVGFEHDGPQSGRGEHRLEDLLAESGEEFHEFDAARKAGGDAQRVAALRGAEDGRTVVGDVDADLGQRRVIVGAEGAQRFGAAFGGAVGPEQAVLEVERHFGDDGTAVDAGSGDFDGRDEVLAAVGAQDADGDLAAGEDHGLGEVFQQETQRRGRIGHRVGAVQDDESVVSGVVVADELGQSEPVCGFDVRGVDHRVDRVDVDIDVEAFQRGELLIDAAEIERNERSGRRIGLHADGAARVDDQNGGSHIVYGVLFQLFF